MTEGQWTTLTTVLPILELHIKHGINRRPDQIDKQRMQYLCDEFGLQPIDWSCAGCIASRKETLYRIYVAELAKRAEEQGGTKVDELIKELFK